MLTSAAAILVAVGVGCHPGDGTDGNGNSLEITDLTVEASEHCSLVAEVRWRTTIEASASVEFGLTEIPEFVVDHDHTGTEHVIFVVGMRPGEHHTLYAVARSEEGEEIRSEPLTFAAGEVPEPWAPITIDVHDAERAQQG